MIYQVLARKRPGGQWKPYSSPISDAGAAMRLVQQANLENAEVTVLQASNVASLCNLLGRLHRGELTRASESAVPSLTATPRVSVRDEHEETWEVRRWDIEQGPGGDHDTPYHFELPQDGHVLAVWRGLIARRQHER